MKGFSFQLFFPSQRESHSSVPDMIFWILSYGRSYKITTLWLSTHQQFRIFIRSGLFWSMVNIEVFFFQENSFFPRLEQKLPKMTPKKDYLGFLKNFIISFSGNNLKWKLILLLISHHQSHIWEILVLELWTEMLLVNRNAGFFKR